MRVEFGAGYSIQNVITGFETHWLYVDNIPPGKSSAEILQLLSKYGTVKAIKIESRGTEGGLCARARFLNNIEARNASVALNGRKEWGSTIFTQLPVNNAHGQGALLRDTAVRLEWEAPSVVAYAGYPTEERALKAIAISKAEYRKTNISAHLYTGLPQMGPFTVRFRNLPLDIDNSKEYMNKYSQPLDLMWDFPNYTNPVDSVAKALRQKLEMKGIEIASFDVLPPPYHRGMVQAWIRLPSPTVARNVCRILHLQKPDCTGKTRIFAYDIQSLSYPIPLEEYKKIEGDVSTFRDRLHREVPGTGLTIHIGSTVLVKLFAADGKDLRQLKAEFEKIRGGEVIINNGEIVWDPFFGLTEGKVFLRRLEIAHLGLNIREDPWRRRIVLFGQSRPRELAKKIIIKKVSDSAAHRKRYLSLGHLIGPFFRYEFSALSERVGPDNVTLDFRNRRLVLSTSGEDQDQTFTLALQAVGNLKRKQNPDLSQCGKSMCPVCLEKVDHPVTLSQCKHSYCRSCFVCYLQAAIESKPFPLICLGDEGNCSSLIPISLSRRVLPLGDFDALIQSAFEAHIHERPKEYHFCPSLDCMQVYRSAPGGNVLQCPSCLLRICSQCHAEQHDGFRCLDLNKQEKLFSEWAKEHDVKSCPKCEVLIERAEGCNHVTCTRCRAHICWVCLRTFPGGDGIYSHMRAEHGGIGNAFDMDGL
jgi:hypothetical protein